MVDRFYGYQYETSPRKLQPEFISTRNKNQNKKSTTKSVSSKRVIKKVKVNKQTSKNKQLMSRKKIVMYVLITFGILFVISYRNAIISESFTNKENLKKELSSMQKTNQQLQISIENNLNLNSIEAKATQELGMQKLDNTQKIYVSLPKKDYVEVATEEVIIEDNLNFFQKLIKGFTDNIE